MRVLDVEQGSREWVEARLGIPTASAFKRIVTSTGKLSAQRDAYQAELLSEWVFGEPAKDFDTTWTERGKVLEPDARRYYSFHTDTEARTVGFCVLTEGEMKVRAGLIAEGEELEAPNGFGGARPTTDPAVGASPDGLVGDDGLLELKCPREDTHMLYLARGVLPSEYRAQVQGQLWVTGRAWADFMSYCPELPPFLIRLEPDPKFQAALDDHMPVFHAELMAGRQRLIEKGVTPWQK